MPNTRISDLTAAASVAGTDVYPSVQTAGVGPVKTSLTQITAFALANAPAGAVAAPSIAPTGDPNTGFWFPAADTIAASTGGSERLRINSSGNVGIGTTSIPASARLALGTGNIVLTDLYSVGWGTQNTYIYGSSTTAKIFLATNNVDRVTIDNTGNVGIGTTSPGDRFVVENASANVKARVSAGGSASYTASLALGTTSRDWEITAGSSSSNYLFSLNYTGTDTPLSNIFVATKSGNLLVGTTSSPTTGTQCLTVGTGTAPTATPADTVTLYSSDLSAGNTMPSFYTEGTIVGTGTPTADRTIAVRINGTVYYLLASTIP